MLGEHKKAVLQFSGGKDSLACLYLAREHKDRIEVHFGDAGATLPHVRDFIERTCAAMGFRLRVVHPTMGIDAYHATAGLPTDLLPVWRTADTEWTNRKRGPVLQSTMRCCSMMLYLPLYNAAVKSGATLVIRGAKEADDKRGVPNGHTENGLTFYSPVWDWTDERVMAYLRQQGAELPAHYSEVNTSFDCWLCTGHTGEPHAANQAAYIKNHYPALWPQLQERIEKVRGAARDEMTKLEAAFAAVN